MKGCLRIAERDGEKHKRAEKRRKMRKNHILIWFLARSGLLGGSWTRESGEKDKIRFAPSEKGKHDSDAERIALTKGMAARLADGIIVFVAEA